MNIEMVVAICAFDWGASGGAGADESAREAHQDGGGWDHFCRSYGARLS